MANILHTTFSCVFSWAKMFVLWFNFHWNCLLPGVQILIKQHWFRWWLGYDQGISHILNQCWPRRLVQYDVTEAQWVKKHSFVLNPQDELHVFYCSFRIIIYIFLGILFLYISSNRKDQFQSNLVLNKVNSLRPSGAYICVSKVNIIGSDNCLSPGHQAIIWANAGILLIGPFACLVTNFRNMFIEIYPFSFKKMDVKMPSVKRRPFCLGFNASSQVMDSLRHLNEFVKHNPHTGVEEHCLLFY